MCTPKFDGTLVVCLGLREMVVGDLRELIDEGVLSLGQDANVIDANGPFDEFLYVTSASFVRS
jgi:hypothetical protein